MSVTDATIESYLVGALSDADAACLEQAVAEDPALEARVMAMDGAQAPVARAFAAVAPPAPASIRRHAGRGWHQAGLVACVPVALAVGLGVGILLGQREQAAPWVIAVADYQVLYQPETVAGLARDPVVVSDQLARSGRAIGADLQAFAAGAIGTAPLLRAQILGLGDQPIIQMVYQLPDGTPLALCITRKGGSATETMAFVVSGLAASRWQTEAHDVLLIADVTAEHIADLARDARALTNAL